jgi:hypothetical protein
MFITSGGNVGIGTTSPNLSGQPSDVKVLTTQGVGGQYGGFEAGSIGQTSSGGLNGFYGFTNASLSAGYKLTSYIGSWLEGGGVTSGADMRFFTQVSGTAGAQERMRITADAYIRLASGTGGIQFNGDTAAANALDDYEEGSWTPALQNATVSYSERSGSYVKIGNYVFVRWGFRISSISGKSGTVTIAGLPYAAVNWGSYQEPNISVSTGGLSTADYAQRARVYKGGGDTSLYGRIANNSDTSWDTSELQNGTWIIGEIFYNV